MTTRTLYRVCPFCGKPGMILHMGGYAGTLYKCPNCQYVGPIALEGQQTEEEDSPANENQNQLVGLEDPRGPAIESEKYIASLWKASRTLNKVGFSFGLFFMAVGAVTVFVNPLPASIRDTYGLSVLGIGAFLTAASGLFLLLDGAKPSKKES